MSRRSKALAIMVLLLIASLADADGIRNPNTGNAVGVEGVANNTSAGPPP